jgi:hypothetical protein
MQKHWICPYCNEDILVTVAERVAHENQCQLNCKYSIKIFPDVEFIKRRGGIKTFDFSFKRNPSIKNLGLSRNCDVLRRSIFIRLILRLALIKKEN